MTKVRAIIIADIEIKDFGQGVKYEGKLGELADQIKKWSDQDDDAPLVEQVLHKITMQERRGNTGPVENIVFRGSSPDRTGGRVFIRGSVRPEGSQEGRNF